MESDRGENQGSDIHEVHSDQSMTKNIFIFFFPYFFFEFISILWKSTKKILHVSVIRKISCISHATPECAAASNVPRDFRMSQLLLSRAETHCVFFFPPFPILDQNATPSRLPWKHGYVQRLNPYARMPGPIHRGCTFASPWRQNKLVSVSFKSLLVLGKCMSCS